MSAYVMPLHAHDITSAMQVFGCGKPMEHTVPIMSVQQKAHMLFGTGSTLMNAPFMTKNQRACALFGSEEEKSNLSMVLGVHYGRRNIKNLKIKGIDKPKKPKSIKSTTEHSNKSETVKSKKSKQTNTKKETVKAKTHSSVKDQMIFEDQLIEAPLDRKPCEVAWKNWNKTLYKSQHPPKINIQDNVNGLGAVMKLDKDGAKGDCKILIHKPVHGVVADATATLTFNEFNSYCVRKAKRFVMLHSKADNKHQITKIVANVAGNNCMNLAKVGFKIAPGPAKHGKYRMEYECVWDKKFEKN